MGTTKGRRTRTSDAAITQKAPPSSDVTHAGANEFMAKLGAALIARGVRAWKAKEVLVALETATGALPDGPTKAYLASNLRSCAAALQRQLAQALEASAPDTFSPTKTKRAKLSKPAIGVPTPADAPPTLLDATLEAAVQRAVAGQLDAGLDPAALALARMPPQPESLEYCVGRIMRPGAGAEDVEAALAAADATLVACNALTGQAGSGAAALALFGPAIAQLQKAVHMLEAASDAGNSTAAAWSQVESLAGRAVLCMHAAAMEVQCAHGAGGAGAEADAASKWWLARDEQPAEEAVVSLASDACCAAVSLRAAARLRSPPVLALRDEAGQEKAVAALAEVDLRQLAPYAAAGTLSQAAAASIDDLKATPQAARCFLALHAAAAQQEVSGVESYLLRMVAARKAAALSSALGRVPAAAALVAAAAAVPAPSEAVDWLHQQPPSTAVGAALASLQQGPQGLSAHLVGVAEERLVVALAAAAQAGGVIGGRPTSGDGGAAADDLLFFVSTEGDTGLLGAEWGADAGSEEGEEEGGEGAGGLNMSDLPDEGDGAEASDGSMSE